VVAVARTRPALAELAATSANIPTEVADAADATVAPSLLDQYEPEVLILVAGANPVMRPLQHQTWETFSVNWLPAAIGSSVNNSANTSSAGRPKSACITSADGASSTSFDSSISASRPWD
jgi:hypothetical protein